MELPRRRWKKLSVFMTVLFPGFGQAVAGHRRAALVWLGLVLVGPLLPFVSMWLVGLPLLLVVASPIDAYFRLRRPVGETPKAFVALIVVITAVWLGYATTKRRGYRLPSSSMYPTLQIGDNVLVDTLSSPWHTLARGDLVAFDQPCNPGVQYLKRVVAVANDTVEIRCDVVYINGQAVPFTLLDAQTSYDDYNESSGQWSTKAASLYRETIDGHDYETYYDAERPGRDRTDRHALDDSALASRTDFPLLGRPAEPGPSCARSLDGGPRVAGQKLGKLVTTKEHAGACEQQMHFVVPEDSIFVLGDNRYNSNDSRYWGVVPVDKLTGRVLGVWLGGAGKRFARIGAVR